MESQPFLGVLLHAIGGLCSAVFYLPYLRVRGWAWETYWLIGGFFSWIVAPPLVAGLMVNDLWGVLGSTPASVLGWSYFFGALWGVGGLMFGLTVRYLGVALGVAMALGYCAAFGTLMPPLVSGELAEVVRAHSGQLVLLGVGVCLAGIAINGWAGLSRDRNLPEEKKREIVKEFDFKRGVIVATFCGIFSASMSWGFAAGKPIMALAMERGTPSLWSNLPVLVVVLWGGFTTNFIWCVFLNLKNRTWRNYRGEWTGPELLNLEPGEGPPKVAWRRNLGLCALAGTTWYMQFFFYSMGTSRMGRYEFSSWTLHMASIIIFGTVCGILLKEWSGVSRRTWTLVHTGLAVLVASTIVVGYGNYLASAPTGH